MSRIFWTIQKMKQSKTATNSSNRDNLSELAVVYSIQSEDERKELLSEQTRTIEALVARIGKDYGICRETVVSIFESHFGFGGLNCLQQRDYIAAVRFLATV
jgi:hypothetical protein